MPATSLWQFLIPDSLLLEIFTYLDIKDLGHVAQVCRLWQRVSQDELMWQGVARRRWKIKGERLQDHWSSGSITGSICPGKVSWRAEVKRLVHHVPCVKSQEFSDAHIDEVLDVCISHRGDMFCTTSKDSCVILWKLDYPAAPIARVDTQELFSWSLTQYSKFNNDDTLLLVCGVHIPDNSHHYWTETTFGRCAVFTVPELVPLQVVHLDPPTLFGAWLTGDIYIGGNLRNLQGAIKIEAHKVPESIPIDHDWKSDTNPDNAAELFYFRGNKHHQMSILVADVACMVEAHDNNDCQSEATSCDISSRCSTCITGRSLTESQPGNIYQLLAFIDDNDEMHFEDGMKRQQLLRGSGDSDVEADFLVNKRMRLNSFNCNCDKNRQSEVISFHPDVDGLGNDASFWDGMGTGAGVENRSQWRSAANTPSEDSLFQSSYQSHRAPRDKPIEKNNTMPHSARGTNSETSLCSACQKAKRFSNQMPQDLNEESSSRALSAKLRPGLSDMTVSSASGCLSDTGSVSITGLSLGSNSEFNLPSSSTRNDEFCLDKNSDSYHKTCVDMESKSVISVNSNISCDRYYNSDSIVDASKDSISTQSDGSPRDGDGNVELSNGCDCRSVDNPVMSDSGNMDTSFDSNRCQCDRSSQSEHSLKAPAFNGNSESSNVQANPSSTTLVPDSTSTERTDSPRLFSNMSRSCSNRLGYFRKYICFVSGAHDAIVVQEVTVDKLDCVIDRLAMAKEDRSVTARDPRDHDKKDYYFFIKNCYITGMCLSHDHRYVYFNYRERARQQDEESDSEQEPDDPLRDVSDRNFHENIKVGVIDLINMCRVEGLTYEGHVGFSGYPAWYICLAACENYLGSGSENARAFLWDRHYQVKLAELQHTHLVVNGLAFSPVDQEVCVSVCDDKSIIIWRSRNRMAELANTAMSAKMHH